MPPLGLVSPEGSKLVQNYPLVRVLLPKGTDGGCRGGPGGVGLQVRTEVYGMSGQWGPAVQHWELSPGCCDHLGGKRG